MFANVMCCRTFSKAKGGAGVRVGYIVVFDDASVQMKAQKVRTLIVTKDLEQMQMNVWRKFVSYH